MKYKAIILGLCMGILLLLSGCFSKTADELFCLPKMPEDYVELNNRINALRDELGAEYASPKTGVNTAPVQLQDLDGDGEAESVVAFFRASSGERPLRICIFHQKPDGSYDLTYTIEGDGLAINSVNYVDLDGDGGKEIVVSWQMGTRQYTLTPYQLGLTDAIELISVPYNAGYIDCDLDRDNRRELMVFRADENEQIAGWAEYYVYEEGQMIRAAAAHLSDNAGSDASIREGYLKDNVPAVYISSRSGDATVTDVFALRDSQLVNVTLDEETGISTQTLRNVEISPADINSDGVLELPQPIPVQEYKSNSTTPNFWIIRWRQFDLDGNSEVVETTYHNITDGWYLTIPEEWSRCITISRDDSRTSQGERAVVFSRWYGNENIPPEEFLRIYRLEGENRELRAQRGNRFVINRGSRLIYAAEFTDIGWNSGVSQEDLASRFNLRRTEWSNQ